MLRRDYADSMNSPFFVNPGGKEVIPMLKDRQMGFRAAAKRVFGLKDGQRVTEFAAELKQLTRKDREQLAAEFSRVLGVKVKPE